MIEDVIGDYKSFLKDILDNLAKSNIDVANYPIDHICFRTKTLNEYEAVKESLRSFSTHIIENVYHDRLIAKFILKEPLVFKQYSISMIELPAPQKVNTYLSGLEHIEMVVGEDFDTFVDKYETIWDGVEDDNVYNKTVFINFDNHKVKFHKRSLLDIIKLENQDIIEI